MAEAAADGATTIHDLPDVIMLSILASVIDTKARNAAALVGWKWLVKLKLNTMEKRNTLKHSLDTIKLSKLQNKNKKKKNTRKTQTSS